MFGVVSSDVRIVLPAFSLPRGSSASSIICSHDLQTEECSVCDLTVTARWQGIPVMHCRERVVDIGDCG